MAAKERYNQLAAEWMRGCRDLIGGVTCIYVPVADVYQSILWYQNNLGCMPTHHNPVEPDVSISILRFPDDEQTRAPAIFLIGSPDGGGRLGARDNSAAAVPAACFITPRIQELFNHLKSNGVNVVTATPDVRESGPSFRFYDPDGNLWEAWQPPQ